ncbi:MAG: alpha/beta hydrolase [Acidobacteriota bacterium]|nr:alpha/beta hydrolase [Acidobacteriota bacterium]MDE3106636.1 alpha/beta hydrolase [Acidobacteriota bacterium]MDE3223368.1 alpha/beta hydrolase [Acidobacteriota bacterium]
MADSLLETAVANWGPRFVANGVDAADYARITSALTTWDEWCGAWSAAADVHVALATDALAQGHSRSAGEAYARASVYFHFAKFLFVHDLTQARHAHQRAVESLNAALPLLQPVGSRHEIPFDGATLVGVFRSPTPGIATPTVLLIPGLDSTKEEFRDVEKSFHDRGMATFALDGPGQGEAEWDLPIRSDWEVVGEVVYDYLRGLSGVNATRVGVWGVSLGGYYAARVASANLPYVATVALSGPYDFGDAWDNLNPLTRHAFQVRAFARDENEARRRAQTLTLRDVAGRITAPLLTIMGKRDRLFSWHEGERLAHEAAGVSELLVLDEGNHGCANVVYRHRPYAADWLAHYLVVDETPTNAKGVS